MIRTIRRSMLVAVAAISLVACGGDDDDARAEEPAIEEVAGLDAAAVTIATFQFAPDPVEVTAGTTITFRNEDKINHSVTAGTRGDPTPEVFDGLLEDAGATFELTLEAPGTYDYFCSFHPGEGMTGQIVVS